MPGEKKCIEAEAAIDRGLRAGVKEKLKEKTVSLPLKGIEETEQVRGKAQGNTFLKIYCVLVYF